VFDPLTMSEIQQGQSPQWKQVEKYGPFHRNDESFIASGK
jgi:hypothetical protein